MRQKIVNYVLLGCDDALLVVESLDEAQICVEMIRLLHPHQIWCPMDLGGKLLHISDY